MLKNIDPCLVLKESTESDSGSLESFKQFYYNTFGTPGTPEFEAKLKEINKHLKKK